MGEDLPIEKMYRSEIEGHSWHIAYEILIDQITYRGALDARLTFAVRRKVEARQRPLRLLGMRRLFTMSANHVLLVVIQFAGVQPM